MNLKRITSVLLALVMLFSLSIASAQEITSKSARQMEVFKSGKSLESKVTLNVNAQTLGALLSQTQGSGSEEDMAQFTTLIGALNKLIITSLSSMTGENRQSGNVTIGTEKAALIDMKADVDMATGENAITANVLPGIVIKMDQAQMAASVQQGLQFQEHPEQLQMLDEKYHQVIADAFTKEILPGLKAEEGKFTEQEVAFDSHMEGDVNSVAVAKFVKAIVAVAKEDEQLKPLLDASIKNSLESTEKAMKAEGKSEPLPFKNADEMFTMIDGKMDEIISKGGDEKVLHLNAYQNKATKQMLVDIETPVSEGSAYNCTVLLTPGENGNSVKANLLMKPVEEGATEPIDWAKVKEAVKSGEDMSATQVALTLDTAKDDAKASYTLNISVAAAGMPLAISIIGDETLTGAYESNAKITLSFLTPDPLAEITVRTAESDKKAEKVNAEGAKVVEIKEDTSDEEVAALGQVLTEKGLPVLMENLSKALPEEAGLIMQLLNGAQEEGTVKAN